MGGDDDEIVITLLAPGMTAHDFAGTVTGGWLWWMAVVRHVLLTSASLRWWLDEAPSHPTSALLRVAAVLALLVAARTARRMARTDYGAPAMRQRYEAVDVAYDSDADDHDHGR